MQKKYNNYTFYLTIEPEECKHYSYRSAVTKPTCTEQGYSTYECKDCYYSWVGSYVDALGHDMQVVTPAVPHTCTEDGATALLACSRCEVTEGGEVDPGSHAYVGQGNGKPATMTESGLTETQICSECGDEIGQVVIPAAPVLTVKVARS